MRRFRATLVVALALTPCSGAAQRKVPSLSEVVDFRADPIPPAPSDHFKHFRVSWEDLKTILESYRVITREQWLKDYHHVAFGDRTGTITLGDKTAIRWLVRPGGLAVLTFPDETEIHLAASPGLSPAQVRRLATKYRDQWLAANRPEGATWLAQGRIVSVERSPGGWHVVFETRTGDRPNTPEGLHIYYLHIHLKPSGELDKVVRGPDILS